MEKEIKEYSLAVKENIEAAQAENTAKDAKRKSYYRLLRAKEALRQKESELLNNYWSPLNE